MSKREPATTRERSPYEELSVKSQRKSRRALSEAFWWWRSKAGVFRGRGPNKPSVASDELEGEACDRLRA